MKHLTTLAALPLLLILLASCGGDDEPAADTQKDPVVTDDPCKKEIIEPDQAFQGPPAGPLVDADGKIMGDTGLIVATTYLRLKEGSDQRFGELVGPVIQDLTERMQTGQGLLALTTSISDTCGVARTMTVWKDEASMMSFVMAAPHLAAIQGTSDVSRGGSVTTTWKHEGGEITWQRAATALKTHDGPIY